MWEVPILLMIEKEGTGTLVFAYRRHILCASHTWAWGGPLTTEKLPPPGDCPYVPVLQPPTYFASLQLYKLL